jgi:hypothetical protein
MSGGHGDETKYSLESGAGQLHRLVLAIGNIREEILFRIQLDP